MLTNRQQEERIERQIAAGEARYAASFADPADYFESGVSEWVTDDLDYYPETDLREDR